MSIKSIGLGSKSSFSANRLGSGGILRDTAAQNLLASKNGRTGFGNQTTKTNASAASNNKNTAVITYDELERIR